MQLKFSKMHGLGNDFVVLDATKSALNLLPEHLRLISNRRLGVGCDQILVAEPATHPDADFFYRMYNADGSESGQCGNGARCMARFLREQGLFDEQRIVVETTQGLMVLQWLDEDTIRVEMGVPRFTPADIPLQQPARQDFYELPLASGDSVKLQALSVGNPHAVLHVKDVNSAPVASLGPELESHPLFPERVNVGFMQIIDAQNIALRVFERGAGETRACGSGACAAVIAGRQQHGLDQLVRVQLPGGTLEVEWQGEGHPVYLVGGATQVFAGVLAL